MELKISNDGLYIATEEEEEEEGHSYLISLEDLIYKFIEAKKNDSDAVAIADLAEINNWLFNYQIDLGDAIDQRKQDSLLEKIKQLRNEIYTSELHRKEPVNYDVRQMIRIKLDDIINNYKFWNEIHPREMGKMDS
tara:strand:- start:114 stop:521 length:408 start_codon:yes stop_codon:yes gene_type:complete